MTEGPIVLADDEPQVRALLRFILSHNAFQVLEAEDGLEALLLVRQLSGKISLFVSDARMPKLDGVTLCKQVKQQFPSIPVLLISGNAEACEWDAGDAFLRKPFHPDALVGVVRDLCNGQEPPVQPIK